MRLEIMQEWNKMKTVKQTKIIIKRERAKKFNKKKKSIKKRNSKN